MGLPGNTGQDQKRTYNGDYPEVNRYHEPDIHLEAGAHHRQCSHDTIESAGRPYSRGKLKAKVLAVCRSDSTGIPKEVVPEVTLKENYGVESDAHASSEWHRQVSLLATESIQKMKDMGYDVGPGNFAENITTEGIELFTLPIGTRLSIGGGVTLEISQIGKDCHTGCAIFQKIGKCVMPKEGIFARVIQGGKIRAGDAIERTG